VKPVQIKKRGMGTEQCDLPYSFPKHFASCIICPNTKHGWEGPKIIPQILLLLLPMFRDVDKVLARHMLWIWCVDEDAYMESTTTQWNMPLISSL
jgi:hypothetical protein